MQNGTGSCRRCTTLSRGFTLIELLVVISIIALLIGILLPSLAAAREVARAMDCSSRMRQLAFAAEIYSGENDEFYPQRNPDDGKRWPEHFQRTYQVADVLICPTIQNPPGNPDAPDFDDKPRTYVFNGFDDSDHRPKAGVGAPAPGDTRPEWDESAKTGLKRVVIVQPSELGMFAERDMDDGGSYWVDIFANNPDDLNMVEQSRHGGSDAASTGSGYSNYAFADGHVETFRFAESVTDRNIWATVAWYRDNFVATAAP